MAGIYIHIPFCRQACHYCDFHFSTSMKHKEEMIEALMTEIALRKDEMNGEIVETIYFGGGTPSRLSPQELEQIIGEVYKHHAVAEAIELTIEVNPDDLIEGDPDKLLQEYKAIGVNRLSIGIQSFREEDLKLMNRAHNAGEALKCLETATKYFDNISVDLIYGIPGLSDEAWKQNIETALSFGIPHISSYALTVEPKTALEHFIKKGVIDDPSDDQAARQFDILVEALGKHGFVHYELSNFGNPGYFSINNSAYWQGKKYLGIGPSAHSYDGTTRSWNIASNPKYIKSLQQGELPLERETLTMKDRYNEYLMTGLRTIWGVSIDRIRSEFGPAFSDHLLEQSQAHIREGYLKLEEDEGETLLKTTAKGKFLADGLASDLFLLNLQES
ncbi:radical SAM family heme chaperone HemW [Robertkochia sediminum]|uniref:radical SAM family heme chaperone HemW n=1 Tax=Robertkochia sediminum TaxID=2785326 RepID=UPI0019321B07|nr:radical SAM family heme chaperone HemW [Robertkochia sediminum]MBL7473857.1 radical SAM family heme chaperone HemW [Robertkochia sediminum]